MPEQALQHSLWRQAPICPAPRRLAHSHWTSHLPFAFWLVKLLRPRLFVELGAYAGASFCAFCQQIDALGLPCEAYAVDTWQGDVHMGAYSASIYDELAAYARQNYPGFASLIKSSFDDALPQFEAGSIDLLHIDGCHSREAMLHDFEAWLPKLSTRGVALMHDIRARLPGYGGVAAWQEISGRFPSFAFPHGYGLGVVLAGPEAPEELRQIANASPAELESFTSPFQEQGKIYEALFGLEERRKAEAAEALRAAESATAEKRELERILAGERASHNEEAERLREALNQAGLRINALTGSLSWKLTAPLRRLAALLRG